MARSGAQQDLRQRSKTCGSAELGRMLRLAMTLGKAEHVRELMRQCRATKNFENEQSGKWAVRTWDMVRKMRGVAG